MHPRKEEALRLDIERAFRAGPGPGEAMLLATLIMHEDSEDELRVRMEPGSFASMEPEMASIAMSLKRLADHIIPGQIDMIKRVEELARIRNTPKFGPGND